MKTLIILSLLTLSLTSCSTDVIEPIYEPISQPTTIAPTETPIVQQTTPRWMQGDFKSFYLGTITHTDNNNITIDLVNEVFGMNEMYHIDINDADLIETTENKYIIHINNMVFRFTMNNDNDYVITMLSNGQERNFGHFIKI